MKIHNYDITGKIGEEDYAAALGLPGNCLGNIVQMFFREHEIHSKHYSLLVQIYGEKLDRFSASTVNEVLTLLMDKGYGGWPLFVSSGGGLVTGFLDYTAEDHSHIIKIINELKMDMEDNPYAILRDQLELITKAGRRCAYDLAHAVDCMPQNDVLTELLRENVKMWKSIFNPGDDGKNYRHHLHNTINQLECEVERLKKLCEQHNISHVDIEREFPF